MSTSALCTALVAAAGMPAHADEVIDNTTETVIGTGGGTQTSPWNISGNVIVGDDNTGALNISAGGLVTNAYGFIGNNAGSDGTVTVDGFLSRWTNAQAIVVGNSGTGALNVTNSGAVSNTFAYIGNSSGSDGAVTVSGANSTWTNSQYLIISEIGAGSLTISNGGAVSNTFGSIGNGVGSDGEVTVTGAGAIWTNSLNLTVGSLGDGTLTIADGGLVRVGGGSGTVTIANDVDANGTLSIGAAAGDAAAGAGTLEAGVVQFGDGTGALNFNHTETDYQFDADISGGTPANSSINQIAGVTILTGDSSGYSGTITVTGGTLGVDGAAGGALGGYLVVRGGAVRVENGGVLTTIFDTDIGRDDVASLTVTGAGSTWTSSASIDVGDRSTATLTIADGGAVSSRYGYIGGETAAVGTTLVTGAGSRWTGLEEFAVGVDGDGTLHVEDGGAVESDIGIVGYFLGSTGTATVDGAGSTWTNTYLTVGQGGAGALTVADGGAVISDYGYIGQADLSVGAVIVTGAGSIWTNSDDVVVADYGEGALTIADGGVVSLGTSGDGRVFLANGSGSTGVINIGAAAGDSAAAAGSLFADVINFGAGTGTINFNHTETDYDFDPTLSGNGAINQIAGVTTLTGDSSGFSGTTIVTGGTLLVDGASGGALGGRVHVYDGAFGIENGGVVSTIGDSDIGENNGDVGYATVTGAGSAWGINDALYVGLGGTGTLNVEDGALAGAESIYIGYLSGADGTVTVTGTGSRLEGDIVVGESGTGALTIADGAAVISGSGRVGNQASGTALVTGADSIWTNLGGLYIGSANEGTLRVEDGGAVNTTTGVVGFLPGAEGTVTVTGAGSGWTSSSTLYVGYDGTATFNIEAGGTVSVGSSGTGNLYLANRAGSTGTLNIGAAAGDAAVGAGTLEAGVVQFGPGAATLNFNHSETDYAFNPELIGFGTINQISGVTRLTAASESFGGDINITGGALYVNGGLGGFANVSGGMLGGSGEIEGASISAGGILAPGNSVGTLNIGDIAFAAGSTFEVELNDGGFVAGTNNDLLNAFGAVTINGGTVHVTPENGTDTGSTYTAGTYTIVTAGTLTGQFDNVTDDFAFLDFVLSYDYGLNEVALTSSIAVTTFCLSSMSANQCAVGEGAFSLGSGEPVFDAVLSLSDAEAPVALDLLSGEIHASAQSALLEDSRFPRDAAMSRLRAVRGGVAADNADQSRSGLWGQAFGAWGQWDSDSNVAALDRSVGGLAMGADAQVSDEVRAGILAGYSRSRLSVDARTSSGTVDTITLGAYGGGEWSAFTLAGGLAHSWHSLDTSRSVVFSAFSDSLSASYDARTLQAWGEAAYSFEAGAARFEPFANLAHVSVSSDGFTERGGAAALTGVSNDVDETFTTLGLRAETEVGLAGANATLRGMAGWRHAFGDEPTSRMRFASGGDAFTVVGVPLGQDTLALDAGVEVRLDDSATLGLAYGGQFGSGVEDHSVGLQLNVRF